MQNHPLKCRIAFREVRRKLLLALEQHETTTDRRDRDVVCGEVFADVTGRLNAGLQVWMWVGTDDLVALVVILLLTL